MIKKEQEEKVLGERLGKLEYISATGIESDLGESIRIPSNLLIFVEFMDLKLQQQVFQD